MRTFLGMPIIDTANSMKSEQFGLVWIRILALLPNMIRSISILFNNVIHLTKSVTTLNISFPSLQGDTAIVTCVVETETISESQRRNRSPKKRTSTSPTNFLMTNIFVKPHNTDRLGINSHTVGSQNKTILRISSKHI